LETTSCDEHHRPGEWILLTRRCLLPECRAASERNDHGDYRSHRIILGGGSRIGPVVDRQKPKPVLRFQHLIQDAPEAIDPKRLLQHRLVAVVLGQPALGITGDKEKRRPARDQNFGDR
jgi:hypothetical protein